MELNVTSSGTPEQVVAAPAGTPGASAAGTTTVPGGENPAISDGQGQVVADQTKGNGDVAPSPPPAAAASAAPVAAPSGSLSANQQARAIRLAAEREATQRVNEKVNAVLSRAGMVNPTTNKPIASFAELEQFSIEAAAKAANIDPDVYRQRENEKQAEAAEKLRLQMENEMLLEQAKQRRYADDLTAIKAAYPEVKAGSISELGQEFVSLMRGMGGNADPVLAYGVVKARQQAASKPTPPSMGSVSSAGAPSSGEYYSEAELDALTPAQLRENTIYNKAMKSYDRLLQLKNKK